MQIKKKRRLVFMVLLAANHRKCSSIQSAVWLVYRNHDSLYGTSGEAQWSCGRVGQKHCKNMQPKRSKAWLYYEPVAPGINTCKKYGKHIPGKTGNTSTMIKHLKHGENFRVENCIVFPTKLASTTALSSQQDNNNMTQPSITPGNWLVINQ